MLIFPYSPLTIRFALIVGPTFAAMTGASCHVQHVLWFSSFVPVGMIRGFVCLAGGEINLIAAFLSVPTHSI